MTVEYTEAQPSELNRRVSENLTTMLFRMGWQQKDLAPALGITPTTIGRKLKGRNDWTIPEIERAAPTLYLSVGELLTELPDWEEWRARRDSNSQPSDP